ncbi:CotH kinase family protein [uncultured Treponema sp.]|uniref:CotH kinase family protein n=1 Tax=uncultured Treponema sp. TaxID=162155 RepID=UPI0026008F7D|nr:CotH kinase family protein [uncultured Treponema sp.]
MKIIHGIRRYSYAFGLSLFLLAFGALFAFLISSDRKITLSECEKLGFPILEISTDKLKEIKSKEKYVKATFTLKNSTEYEEISGKCKLRGHGNSTWKTTFTQKKPYLLKLESPASLLGMKGARKWILMANAADRSMLRNYYAEYLTHNVWNNMRWNPESRYVTLFINGKYRGLYGITEKVEVVENRVEFGSEGFLAEIDSHSGRPYSFSTNSRLNFNIRSPKSTLENYKKWAAKIESLEKLLYSDDWNEVDGYKKYFDMDSFVDWYLLAEFSKNYDANFYNSVFMNYDYSTETLYMGPAWDHDIGFGNTSKSTTTPESYGSLLSNNAWIQMFNFFDPLKNSSAAKDYEGFLINQGSWYNRMFGDDEFVALVKKRWVETRGQLKDSFEWLRGQGEFLDEAAELNDSVWHIIGSANWPRAPGYRSRKTYKSEVDFLVDWCEKRFEWFDMIFME